MRILGIDPGQMGGLAVVDFDKGELPFFHDGLLMPLMIVNKKKALDISKVFEWLPPSIDIGVIEAVHAMPKQGVSSSFQFGRMFGAAETLLYDTDTQAYVSPKAWKKFMNLSSDKGASMDLATRIFGTDEYWQLKKYEGIAEAALIAVYWYRKNILGAKK